MPSFTPEDTLLVRSFFEERPEKPSTGGSTESGTFRRVRVT
jgi:hypothetical protein